MSAKSEKHDWIGIGAVALVCAIPVGFIAFWLAVMIVAFHFLVKFW